MDLIEKIDSDVKQALKAGEKIRVQVLRSVRAMVKNAEIVKQAVLQEADVLKVIQTELKKRKESIDAYVSAGRKELAAQEKEEAEILSTYLPEQLSDDELDQIVKEVADKVEANEKKDFGKLMGAVMKDVGQRAEGNRVKTRVNAFFEK